MAAGGALLRPGSTTAGAALLALAALAVGCGARRSRDDRRDVPITDAASDVLAPDAPADAPPDAPRASPIADRCPGTAVTLSPGRELVVVSDAAGWTDHGAGSCGGEGLRDGVLAVTPAQSGLLTVRVTTNGFNARVYARRACESSAASDEGACADAYGTGEEEVFTVRATAGTPLSIVVDGASGDNDTAAVYLLLAPSCGGGTLEGSEACDDGNATDGDGCSAMCMLEGPPEVEACSATSPAIRLTGGAQWFRGTTTGRANDETVACPTRPGDGPEVYYRVVPMFDGRVRADVLPVDRGGAFDPVLYAREDCAAATPQRPCVDLRGGGRGERLEFPVSAGQSYEVAVDAIDATSGAFQLSLDLARCGDGRAGAGEQCDDGNTRDGDGCSAMCVVEPGCSVTESGVTSAAAPQALPIGATCATAAVTAAIPSASDQDFFTFEGRAGQVLEAAVFVGPGVSCPNGFDNALEVYPPERLSSDPRNGECDGNTTAAECNDDSGASLCSAMSHALPVTGVYTLRVFDLGLNSALGAYTLRVTLRDPR